MQQKFSQNTTVMPPSMPQVGAMPVISHSHLPPPPPSTQPAPLPPPPPENEAKDALNNQRSFQAAASGSINRSSNFQNQAPINQQFNRNIGGAISQSPNQFTHATSRKPYESNPPASNELASKSTNQIAEEASDKTPEEKAFDEQFKKWEEEFTNWKLQNANHPDTRAYLEYEQKMEECRTKLLERREQMKRRKLELLQQQQQKQQQSQPSVQVTSIAQEQPRLSNEQKISGYSHSSGHSSGSLERNDSMDRIGSGNVQPLLDNSSSNHQSQLFLRGSASGSGIPGLDLVVDKHNANDENDDDVNHDTVIINDMSPKRDDKTSHQNANIQQRPDLEAISRGITSILGDPNLASLLSNFQPKSIPNPVAKSAIPSLLDMKMPDIDLDNVPRFDWNDDDQDSLSSNHQGNDLSTNILSNENTQQNSNHMNNCDEEQYDDDFDREHERFAEMNQDDSNDDDRPFPMNSQGDNNHFNNAARDDFNRNRSNPGNNFGSSKFMNGNEPTDNFHQNRSNFMNDNGQNDNFQQNRRNFANDNFQQNRFNFNENVRGNNSFAGNAGNFNQPNSFGVQGMNRMNPFDKPAFGNNSNFNADRNQMGNNFPSNFGANNNFANNFGRSLANDPFNNENMEFKTRNDDRTTNTTGNTTTNINDFCRRRNDFDEPNFDTNSNSQFASNFRNNSRSDDNNVHSQNNSHQFNSAPNRSLPADSFISDNAKDEDFFRPIKVIDYSANSKKPTQIVTNEEILKPMKVVDYGHQTVGIVSRNALHPRPANKYTGGEFFPVKTIDYNHSSNKHMIKEYYYSIVSKWDPTLNNAKSLQQQLPNNSSSSGNSSNNQPIHARIPPPQNNKAKELKEISYEQLSSINTSTRQGKKMKRALIMKVSTHTLYLVFGISYHSVQGNFHFY